MIGLSLSPFFPLTQKMILMLLLRSSFNYFQKSNNSYQFSLINKNNSLLIRTSRLWFIRFPISSKSFPFHYPLNLKIKQISTIISICSRICLSWINPISEHLKLAFYLSSRLPGNTNIIQQAIRISRCRRSSCNYSQLLRAIFSRIWASCSNGFAWI